MSRVLNRVVRDINAVLTYLPARSPHLAWRLNPEDYMELRFVMSQQMSLTGEIALPAGELFVLGVRVLEDPTAPLFDDMAEAFQ